MTALVPVTQPVETKRERTRMDNPPACGAPKGWRWGYLPCGCRNDGHGEHVH